MNCPIPSHFPWQNPWKSMRIPNHPHSDNNHYLSSFSLSTIFNPSHTSLSPYVKLSISQTTSGLLQTSTEAINFHHKSKKYWLSMWDISFLYILYTFSFASVRFQNFSSPNNLIHFILVDNISSLFQLFVGWSILISRKLKMLKDKKQ